MLREWAFHHLVAGEQTADTLGVHDERTDRVGGLRGRRIVGDVDADPPAAVPLNDRLGRVPGIAGQVGTGAVVENSPVGRPRPGPVRRNTLLARVRRIAPRHLVALLGVAAREDPAADEVVPSSRNWAKPSSSW